MMRALYLSKEQPDATPSLSLKTVPNPAARPEHLLVKVHASAIQPSDLLNARGNFGLTTFPRIPGRDFSGVVADGPRTGEEVYGTSGFTLAFSEDGSHAEYVLVPVNGVAPKPKNLSFVQAAVVGVPFTTASLVLKRARAKQSDVVMVLGANGAVGSAAVQIAGSLGCNVITATRSDAGDVNTAKDPSLDAIDALTSGRGVDVIVDTVGQPALTKAAVAKLARQGRLAMIAAPRAGSTELALDMTDFYRKEKDLVGCNTLLYSVAEMAQQLTELSVSFDAGSLKPPAESEYTKVQLEDGVLAYEKAKQRGAGKFVIVMG